MHTATPQVIAALNHVRTLLPEVTQVLYTVEQKWLYMTDEGKAPAFGALPFDISLLEDAVDSLTTFPVAFHYTTPVSEPDRPVVAVIVRGGMCADVVANQPGVRVRVYDFDSLDDADEVDYESEIDEVTPFHTLDEAIGQGPVSQPYNVPPAYLTLLERAESFISGFEDDDEQEGVDELLAKLRAAIAEITPASDAPVSGEVAA